MTARKPLKRWLSQQEAADYLGVTDRSIRNYIARGDLTAYRVRGSRLVRIDRADIDGLLRQIPAAEFDRIVPPAEPEEGR